MHSNEDSEVPVFLGNLLDPVIKGIISKEMCLVLSETCGPCQSSRVIGGFFCRFFTVCIIGTMLSWLTALHRKWKSEKENSKGNIYHAGRALAESIAHLCRTSTRLLYQCCRIRWYLRIRSFMIIQPIGFLVFISRAISLVSIDLCPC